MVRDRGFEPLTPSVSRKCSTTELTAQLPKDPGESLAVIGLCANFSAWEGATFDTALQAKTTRSQNRNQKGTALALTPIAKERSRPAFFFNVRCIRHDSFLLERFSSRDG